MALTSAFRTFLSVGTVLLLAVALAACGTSSDQVRDSPGSAKEGSSEFPPALAEALVRDELDATRMNAASGAISEEEALAAFSELYDPSGLPGKPTPYFVEINESMEGRLPPGRQAWMMHVPGVEQTPSIDTGDRGSGEFETVVTDMLAFFDSKTGEHLVTDYVGPAKG
jgi:hypothetical protein